MNKTQAGRLLTLAWFLKTQVDPENFDMGCYGRYTNAIDDIGEHECGSAACALGWSTFIWPDRFTLSKSGLTRSGSGAHRCALWDNEKDGFIDCWDDEEICDFFGLRTLEARMLFSPAVQCNPYEKSRQIEQLVESHGWTYAA